jgi:hypothetical protein
MGDCSCGPARFAPGGHAVALHQCWLPGACGCPPARDVMSCSCHAGWALAWGLRRRAAWCLRSSRLCLRWPISRTPSAHSRAQLPACPLPRVPVPWPTAARLPGAIAGHARPRGSLQVIEQHGVAWLCADLRRRDTPLGTRWPRGSSSKPRSSSRTTTRRCAGSTQLAVPALAACARDRWSSCVRMRPCVLNVCESVSACALLRMCALPVLSANHRR